MTPVEYFKKYFSIVPVANKKLLDQSFNVRYQVFCEELGYFGSHGIQTKLESDEYDAQSEHCILIHKPTNRAVASARLIGVDPVRPESMLPYETLCAGAIDRSSFDPDMFLPGQILEISRLAVLGDFRNPAKRDPSLPENADLTESCGVPIIPVSLFVAIASMILASEAEYAFALIEPKLARMLRRYGFYFELVGEPVDYHGWRSPFLIHRDNILRQLKRGVGDLFFEINQVVQGLSDNGSVAVSREEIADVVG